MKVCQGSGSDSHHMDSVKIMTWIRILLGEGSTTLMLLSRVADPYQWIHRSDPQRKIRIRPNKIHSHFFPAMNGFWICVVVRLWLDPHFFWFRIRICNAASNPTSIGVKYSPLGFFFGGGRHLKLKLSVFDMTKAVSDRDICFIKAALLLYKHG